MILSKLIKLLIFHNSFDSVFLNNISLALDFRTFLEYMKMSSSFSKIYETGINVFKSKYQIVRNKKKYYEISTIYECVEKSSLIIGVIYE